MSPCKGTSHQPFSSMEMPTTSGISAKAVRIIRVSRIDKEKVTGTECCKIQVFETPIAKYVKTVNNIIKNKTKV